MRVLAIEDGYEYSDLLRRFLPDLSLQRAGGGAEALAAVAASPPDAIVLDMRFHRVADAVLLGDRQALTDRFAGDRARARAWLQDQQGLYILSALREAECRVPVLISYDFSAEPSRWERLVARYAPVDYVADLVGPAGLRERLRALIGAPARP